MVRPLLPRLHHARRLHRFICPGLKSPGHATNRSFATSSSIMDEPPPNAGVGMFGHAIARSQSSLDVQTIAPELPDMPRVPTRKRTFHLSHEDLETHVRPLLSCHWHVGHVGDGAAGPEVFTLNKLFSFKTFRSAVEFFDALADIQDEEDHHARVTVDYANVYVSTHTHVAYQRTSGDVGTKPLRVPGLTSRDVRFAVRVERLHHTFLGDERAITKVPVGSASIQTLSMEQLWRRYPPRSSE